MGTEEVEKVQQHAQHDDDKKKQRTVAALCMALLTIQYGMQPLISKRFTGYLFLTHLSIYLSLASHSFTSCDLSHATPNLSRLRERNESRLWELSCRCLTGDVGRVVSNQSSHAKCSVPSDVALWTVHVLIIILENCIGGGYSI